MVVPQRSRNGRLTTSWAGHLHQSKRLTSGSLTSDRLQEHRRCTPDSLASPIRYRREISRYLRKKTTKESQKHVFGSLEHCRQVFRFRILPALEPRPGVLGGQPKGRTRHK